MSAPTRVISYIDGFNLYFGLKSKGWKKYYYDLSELLSKAAPPNLTR